MILDNVFPPDPRVENEAMSLINDGHEVFLFALSYKMDFKKYEKINGIHVHRFYCSKIMYKFSALAYTVPIYHLHFKHKIKQFIEEHSLQYIHVHDLQIARSIFYLKKKLNLKITLDLHENRPEIMRFYSHVNSTLGKLTIYPSIWKKFEEKYIHLADKVIVVTESAVDYYAYKFNADRSKFVVVPNTVRKEFYEDFTITQEIIDRFKGQFNFLYLGETGRRRGTFELIEAMKILKEKDVKANLIMVGTSKDEPVLRDKVKEFGLEHSVFIEGWQKFDLFQSYLSVSQVGMCPLHRNIHHDTTFANKIFQYASFGLPVIASDSTAQMKVLKQMKCGIFHKEKNTQELAEKMVEIYSYEKELKELSKNAKKAIESSFNWGEISKSLLKLYANCST
jgi:glycosyltransferase involved in cell wall biosynthesis